MTLLNVLYPDAISFHRTVNSNRLWQVKLCLLKAVIPESSDWRTVYRTCLFMSDKQVSLAFSYCLFESESMIKASSSRSVARFPDISWYTACIPRFHRPGGIHDSVLSDPQSPACAGKHAHFYHNASGYTGRGIQTVHARRIPGRTLCPAFRRLRRQ